MHTYTDLDVFATSVQMIDDTDPPVAVNINTSPEGLANRTRWLRNRGVTFKFQVMTNGATWTASSTGTLGVAFLEGNGGGGGGGGGIAGSNTDELHTGGGGGGSAIRRLVSFLPGSGNLYTATVGGGGAGGTVANPGADGGDTYFTNTTASFEVARWAGAMGGAAGLTTSEQAISLGGAPVRSAAGASRIEYPVSSDFGFVKLTVQQEIPGHGGYSGANTVTSVAGIGDPAGSPGAMGANAAGGFIGGAGGGGAGGCWKAGVTPPTGGAGGAASAAGTGVAGAVGGAVNAPGSGCGGAGGGSGGSGLTGGGAGAAGGNGNTGSLVLYWTEIGTI